MRKGLVGDSSIIFVELDKNFHDRKSFDCRQDELNDFIASSAARHREAGLSKTLVLPEDAALESPVGICVFYTLSHTDIKRKTLPKAQA